MKNKKEQEIRQLTPEELAEEERRYQACKKPIKVGWHLFACATILYVLNAFFAKNAMDNIGYKKPIVEQLDGYRESDEYNNYIADIQRNALDKLTNGEITVDEYQYIIDTSSNDEKFEEFLRSLEDDPQVQKVVENYDKYYEHAVTINRRYSMISVVSLSTLLVSNLILAKYRFREDDIEDARKKRAEALNQEEDIQQ